MNLFIEHLWFYSGFFPEHSLERLLPDGAVEVLFDLAGPPKKLFEDEAGLKYETFRGAWISGQRRRFIVIGTEQNSSMMGIRFRPGGAFPFVGFPMCELNDRVVPMENVWGARINDIHEQLLHCDTAEGKFDILEQTLLKMVSGISGADRLSEQAIAELKNAGPDFALSSLPDKLGVGERQLRRLFEARIGLGPKALARVFRIQTVLQRLTSNPKASWVDIALRAGYYDQAHFVHDFRELTGLTPSQYLTQRRFGVNYVGVPPTSR